MNYFKILSVFFAFTVLFSCTEHEVIPPPKIEVDLNCSFSALIDSVEYELNQDVDGYYCEASQAKEILPTPQLSTVTYYSSIKSDVSLGFVQIGIGKLRFDADAGIDPTTEQFSSFFNSNSEPTYSFEAEEGVEIVYRDLNGNIWMSNEDSDDPQNFTFTSLTQESDEEGDYMKFTATFNAELYNDLEAPTDSIMVENAIFEGYFEK